MWEPLPQAMTRSLRPRPVTSRSQSPACYNPRVHVLVWHIPGPSRASYILTLGLMYPLYGYVDPLGQYPAKAQRNTNALSPNSGPSGSAHLLGPATGVPAFKTALQVIECGLIPREPHSQTGAECQEVSLRHIPEPSRQGPQHPTILLASSLLCVLLRPGPAPNQARTHFK